MGKRKNQKSQSKYTKNSLNLSKSQHISSDESSVGELTHIRLTPEAFSYSIPENIEEIQEDVITSLNQIYNEYFNDFLLRKEKRLSSKSPLEQIQQYNLAVDKTFRKKLRDQIKQLIFAKLSTELTDSILDCAHNFIESLDSQIEELEGKSKALKVVCLYEAFHSLQNAASEIGKIVRYLFIDPSLKFEEINKLIFYEKIVKDQSDIIEYVKNNHSQHYLVPVITKMEKDLKYMWKDLENHYKFPLEYKEITMICNTSDNSDSSSDTEDKIEPLHNMPIDELVNYINGEGKKNSKLHKKKRKNKNTENQIILEDENVDKEVEDFMKKLEQNSMWETRIKPKITDEFVNNLRNQIRETKYIFASG